MLGQGVISRRDQFDVHGRAGLEEFLSDCLNAVAKTGSEIVYSILNNVFDAIYEGADFRRCRLPTARLDPFGLYQHNLAVIGVVECGINAVVVASVPYGSTCFDVGAAGNLGNRKSS